MTHILYTNADKDCPQSILDRNGDVALGLCRICGRGERELAEPCMTDPQAARQRIAMLEADRNAWKLLAEDWMKAADLSTQPDDFYEGYSEKNMRAMQALLTRAQARIAELEAEVAQWDEFKQRDVYQALVDARAEVARLKGRIAVDEDSHL